MIRLITRRTYADIPGFIANLWKKKFWLCISYYQIDIQYSDQFQSTETLLFFGKKAAQIKLDKVSALYKQIHDKKMIDDETAATLKKEAELADLEKASLASDQNTEVIPVRHVSPDQPAQQPAVPVQPIAQPDTPPTEKL